MYEFTKKSDFVEELLGLRNILISKAYGKSVNGEPIHEIVAELKKTALRFVASEIYRSTLSEKYVKEAVKEIKDKDYGVVLPLLLMSISLAKRIKKFSVSRKADSEAVYTFMKQERMMQTTKQPAYKIANDIEAKSKDIHLEDILKENRHKEVPEIFYLASEHGDCAEDHENYQGKLYIDNRWRKYITDKSKIKAITGFVSKNHISYLQYVLGRPIWLITRPNCRHYIVSVPTAEVLSGKSIHSMLSERNMISSVGRRGIRQTIRHSIDKGWYTRENVESIIKQYESRLSYLLSLEKAYGNDEISRDISKTRLLVKKWKDYLKTHSSQLP